MGGLAQRRSWCTGLADVGDVSAETPTSPGPKCSAFESGIVSIEIHRAAELLPPGQIAAQQFMVSGNVVYGVAAQCQPQRGVRAVKNLQDGPGCLLWVARLAAVHAVDRGAGRAGRYGILVDHR